MTQVKKSFLSIDNNEVVLKLPNDFTKLSKEDINAFLSEIDSIETCKRLKEGLENLPNISDKPSAIDLLSKNPCFTDLFNQVDYLDDSKMSFLRNLKIELNKKLEEVEPTNIESLLNVVDNLESSASELANSSSEHFTNWYSLVDSVSDIQVYGQILYSYFILHVLLVGLILLLVLIGVVYLTNSYKLKSTEQFAFKQLSRKPK